MVHALCLLNALGLQTPRIFISVINQLDAQNFCFTVSLFHASTCFEHMCLSSGGQKLHYTASGIITPIGDDDTTCCITQF